MDFPSATSPCSLAYVYEEQFVATHAFSLFSLAIYSNTLFLFLSPLLDRPFSSCLFSVSTCPLAEGRSCPHVCGGHKGLRKSGGRLLLPLCFFLFARFLAIFFNA